MTKRLILLVSLLALAVGSCGDDAEDRSTDGSRTAPAQGSVEGKSGTTAGSGGSPSSQPSATREAKEASEECKEQVEAVPQYSPEIKKSLGKLCETHAQDDRQGTLKAAEEACRALIEDRVPAGTASQSALKSCDLPSKP